MYSYAALELEIKERVIALRKERKRSENENSKRNKRLFERNAIAPVVAAVLPEREQRRKGHKRNRRRRKNFSRKNRVISADRHKSKHRLPDTPSFADVIRTEKHPAKEYNHLRNQNLHESWCLVIKGILVVRTFHDHEERMVQAPANKRPVCTMPNATGKHHEEQVQVQTP